MLHTFMCMQYSRLIGKIKKSNVRHFLERMKVLDIARAGAG